MRKTQFNHCVAGDTEMYAFFILPIYADRNGIETCQDMYTYCQIKRGTVTIFVFILFRVTMSTPPVYTMMMISYETIK